MKKIVVLNNKNEIFTFNNIQFINWKDAYSTFDLVKVAPIMNKKFNDIFSLDVFRNSKKLSVSPERYALSLTFGFYIGLFPMFGVTVLLCLISALFFRLNTWLVQGMNIIMAPLHYLMFYPFLKLGRILFFNDSQVVPHISLRQFFGANTLENISYLFETAIGGIIVWGLLSSLTGFFVYRVFLKYRLQFVKKLSKNYPSI